MLSGANVSRTGGDCPLRRALAAVGYFDIKRPVHHVCDARANLKVKEEEEAEEENYALYIFC